MQMRALAQAQTMLLAAPRLSPGRFYLLGPLAIHEFGELFILQMVAGNFVKCE
jgi:hypothetical protein